MLERAIKSLGNAEIVLLGDYVLDAYLYGETARVSREAPVMVVRKERLEQRLGGAANTAANLASLGAKTRALGVVGQDEAGHKVQTLLQSFGIDVSLLRASKDFITPVKMRVLAGAFGTSKQQVLRIDEEPTQSIRDDLDELIAQDLQTTLKPSDILIVSDYGMQGLGPKTIAMIQKLAKQGFRMCIDSRYRLHSFAHATVITPNIPEAEAVVGFPIVDQSSALKAGETLLEAMRVEACLLTQGRQGMTLFRKNQQPEHVDIVGLDEVTDVTGAGDTVIATFSAALAAGLGMYNGMVLANCAAGMVVTKMGCAQVQPLDLIDMAQTHGLELQAWDA